jgi:hypothetical protein
VRDKRAEHAIVEARVKPLFAFKAVGAHLLSEDKRAKQAVVEARLTRLSY